MDSFNKDHSIEAEFARPFYGFSLSGEDVACPLPAAPLDNLITLTTALNEDRSQSPQSGFAQAKFPAELFQRWNGSRDPD